MTVREPSKSLDDFFRLGKYTFLVCVICEMIILLQAGNLFYMVFGGAAPRVTGCSNNSSIPTSGLSEDELCGLYHSGQCDPIVDYQFYSMNMEWKLLCNDGKQIKDSTSYQMIGYMLGTLVFGQISDTYGRKWPMFICLLMTGILGVATAFAPNLVVFTLIRVALSFFNSGHICIVMVYMCEKFPKKHRMWLNFILSWSPNIILLTVMAYLCKDWRTFSIVLNSLGFTSCLLLLFANESVYWLIRKGRIEEAESVLKKIIDFDGSVVDTVVIKNVLESEYKQFEKLKSSKTYSFQHLFYTWTLAGYTTMMILSYFSVSIINYGIMFNMETLSGSMYFNTMIVGVVRFGLNVLSALAEFNIKSVGRKTTHYVFAGYTFLAILVILGVQITGYTTELSKYTRYIIITAGSVICQIYVINGVTCSEIYPTPIRNIAYSTTQLAGSLGSIAGPQIFRLREIDYSAPFVVMLAFLIGEIACTHFLIPESKGNPLADMMPPSSECIFRRDNKGADVELNASASEED